MKLWASPANFVPLSSTKSFAAVSAPGAGNPGCCVGPPIVTERVFPVCSSGRGRVRDAPCWNNGSIVTLFDLSPSSASCLAAPTSRGNN